MVANMEEMMVVFEKLDPSWVGVRAFRPMQTEGMSVEAYYNLFCVWKNKLDGLNFPADEKSYIDDFNLWLKWDLHLRVCKYPSKPISLDVAFYRAKLEESMLYYESVLGKSNVLTKEDNVFEEMTRPIAVDFIKCQVVLNEDSASVIGVSEYADDDLCKVSHIKVEEKKVLEEMEMSHPNLFDEQEDEESNVEEVLVEMLKNTSTDEIGKKSDLVLVLNDLKELVDKPDDVESYARREVETKVLLKPLLLAEIVGQGGIHTWDVDVECIQKMKPRILIHVDSEHDDEPKAENLCEIVLGDHVSYSNGAPLPAASTAWSFLSYGEYAMTLFSCDKIEVFLFDPGGSITSLRIWKIGNSFSQGWDGLINSMIVEIVSKHVSLRYKPWVEGVATVIHREGHVMKLFVLDSRGYWNHDRHLNIGVIRLVQLSLKDHVKPQVFSLSTIVDYLKICVIKLDSCLATEQILDLLPYFKPSYLYLLHIILGKDYCSMLFRQLRVSTASENSGSESMNMVLFEKIDLRDLISHEFLFQWAPTAFIDPRHYAGNLIYIVYNGCSTSCICIFRGRKLDRNKKQLDWNVFHCLILCRVVMSLHGITPFELRIDGWAGNYKRKGVKTLSLGLDEGRMFQIQELWKQVTIAESTRHVVNMIEAWLEAILIIESKLSKDLYKFSRELCDRESLGVADTKFGKVNLGHREYSRFVELLRDLRNQWIKQIIGWALQNFCPMHLNSSRVIPSYTLKFIPSTVDTMVIQTSGFVYIIGKDLKAYDARAHKWFCFSELAKQLELKELLILFQAKVRKLIEVPNSGHTISVEMLNNCKSAITNVLHQIGRYGATEKGQLKHVVLSIEAYNRILFL